MIFRKFIIPTILIVAIYFGVTKVASMREAPPKRPKPTRIMSVETMTPITQKYPQYIRTQGTVKPFQKSMVSSQVGGLIINVSTKLKVGTLIRKGEVLIEIEKKDLKAQLEQALASLILQEQKYIEIKTKAEQEINIWKKHGKGEEGTPLRLYEPQLKTAQANIKSAKASIQVAELNIQRATIKAPFDGFITKKNIEINEVINPRQILFEIVASNKVEVRVPLSTRQLKQINTPLEAPLQAILSYESDQWKGKLVRVEAESDLISRQVYGIIEVESPYTQEAPLRLGQFVKAEIYIRELENILLIPRQSVREGRKVYLATPDDTLKSFSLSPIWEDENYLIINDDNSFKENQLITTVLGTLNDGLKIKIINSTKQEGELE